MVCSAEAGDLERASGFFKAEARQLRLPLKSAVMKALGKDGVLDEVIIDELLARREVIDRLKACQESMRSRNKRTVMLAFSDLFNTLGDAR